ncbi:hypothetical protein OBK30_01940 [Empedobacter falsenii]
MTKAELKAAKEKYFQKSKLIREITSEKLIKETEEEQEKRIKHLLKPNNYGEFFDYYFGIGNELLSLGDAKTPQFHIKDYISTYNNPYIKQMRKKFRGAGKSIQSNIGNITHLKENNLIFFPILIGANLDLGKILLSDLQCHLESNQLYIKDFGLQLSYGDWSDGDFETTDNKHFKALGLNQKFRGLRFGANRPDLAILDDIEDRERAQNPDMVRKYGEKITGDLVKALHRKRGRVIVNNNYIVKDGILDFLKERWKDDPNFEESITNLATKNITKDNYMDIDWEPSFPERDTKEDVIRIIKADDYYTSQREDFNNPIEEGKLFKAEAIIQRIVHDDEVWDGLLAHWDLSYSRTGDFKAGVLLGVQGIDITVLAVFCERCEVNTAMDVHFDWVKRWIKKGYTIMGFYDATAAQQVVFTPIILQAAEDAKCAYIPMPMHQEGDKHNRIATGVTNALFRKILTWDKNLAEDKQYKEFMKQVLAFEKGTTNNDDAPDTLERGITLSQMFFGFTKDNQESSKPTIGRKKRRRV